MAQKYWLLIVRQGKASWGRGCARVSINSITVASVDVSSAGEARDLSMWLDSKLTMSTHINKTCGAAFF